MRIFLAMVFVGFLSACGSAEFKTTENLNSNNMQKVDSFFMFFNKHDIKNMASFYADSAQMKDPEYGLKTVYLSNKDIVKKYSELHKAIPDIHDSVIATYEGNNFVTVEFVSTGTSPDKKPFNVNICTILVFNKNGKIVKDYTYYDL